MFIFSVVALGTSLFLYIHWYVQVSTGVANLVRKYKLDPEQVFESQTWVVILVLSVLVGLILIGIFTIFVYNQKLIQLYRMQHRFINNFTHELKTPVTSLKLYLETFVRYDLSRNDQLKYIGYMIHDVGRLSDNVNRILDLAKIESRSYGGEFSKQEIVSTVGRFLEENKHLFENCTIKIHNRSGRSFYYSINQSLFEMLLMNLLTNAMKYNESDAPHIDLEFIENRGKLHIRCTDNGIGLEKTQLKKVFKKFYQVGESDNMSAKGSGIGLYLVQSIARMHKGKVTAESEGIGKGTSFTLILPLQRRKMEAYA
jgi:signal transduction histidine kinase